MKISSSVFENNRAIPIEYTCDGEDINPPLSFADIPNEAQSLALLVEDSDAPTGSFIHWLIWNINPSTEDIEEGEVPLGAVEGINNTGSSGYSGPCPPSGIHHYHFRLLALDTSLSLKPSSTKEEFDEAVSGHTLAQTELVGLYGKTESGQEEVDNF